MKKLDKLIYKCFRKIGIKKEKINHKQDKLYNEWKELKTKTDTESKEKLKKVEAELADEFFEKVKDASEDIDCEEGGTKSEKLWNLKKQARKLKDALGYKPRLLFPLSFPSFA